MATMAQTRTLGIEMERLAFLVFGMMVAVMALGVVAFLRGDWIVLAVIAAIEIVGFFVQSGIVYVAKRLP